MSHKSVEATRYADPCTFIQSRSLDFSHDHFDGNVGAIAFSDMCIKSRDNFHHLWMLYVANRKGRGDGMDVGYTNK